MNTINDHYYRLKELLKIEKEEDFTQHKNYLDGLTLQQKLESGYVWQPVKVMSTGYTLGGRVYVLLEKTKITNHPNQLLPGRPVLFYTTDKDYEKTEIKASVYSLGKTNIKLILNSKDLPEWIGNSVLGIELDFDERSYKVMEKALDDVISSKDENIINFKEIFAGIKQPGFRKEHPIEIAPLNASQNEALNYILSCNDIGVVHGPPGTGKTTTLVQTIKATLLKEKQVLVTGPSNISVDILVDRLVNAGVSVVRVGNISRIDETILSHTLDAMVESHHEYNNIKKIKIEAASIRKEAFKFKRVFNANVRMERQKLKKEAKDLEMWARDIEDRIVSEILDNTQVIATTLTSSANQELNGKIFSTVFLDEASQAMEPACWIAFLKAKRIIMTGDPLQLPPTVKSTEAKKKGLDITLLERYIALDYPIKILKIQYRMLTAIAAFSNYYFYDNYLETAEVVTKRVLNPDIKPLVFIDTAGTGFEEQIAEDLKKEMYLSRYNEGEYFIIREHLLQLIEKGINPDINTIVIITPYRAQVRYIQSELETDSKLSKYPIRVNSIDAYQGQESDIVIISLVRSNHKNDIGFLKDYRRMNVAMTRAKYHLALVGDSITLDKDPFFKSLIEFATEHDSMHSAYEYMY